MQKPKILFVDDDIMVLRAAQLSLGSKTIFVTADTGYKCLELLEQDSDYDLMLLDLMLPDINGLELLKQIRTNPSYKIPIIVQTGMSINANAILKLGAEILYKPYSRKDLCKKCIKFGVYL